MSEAEIRAYIIADNRLAMEGGWDKDMLADELQGLFDLGFDLELTGFDVPEIDLILEENHEARGPSSGPEDVVPQISSGPAVTQRGDQWILGNHILRCDNALEQLAYEHLLGGAKAQFVITDPPYNVAIDGNVCGLGKIRHREFVMASGEMSDAQFTEFLETVFTRLLENTVDGAIHQTFMDWRHMLQMLTAGYKTYTELKNLCVWTKPNAGMGTCYRSQHELVFVWKSGTAAHINNFELGQHGRNRTNVWSYPGVNSMRPGRMEELAMHPTVKPVALVVDALKDFSKRGGQVLDPFCGSGTILIAAERTGRKARALEIDPGYVDVAIRRWQKYTGKSALLAGSDDTFEAIEEQRAPDVAALAA